MPFDEWSLKKGWPWLGGHGLAAVQIRNVVENSGVLVLRRKDLRQQLGNFDSVATSFQLVE